MAFYELNVFVLIVVNVVLFLRQHERSKPQAPKPSIDEEISKVLNMEDSETEPQLPSGAAKIFVKQYLIGHLLAFAGDWLQVC
jgi:hypothetical protein